MTYSWIPPPPFALWRLLPWRRSAPPSSRNRRERGRQVTDQQGRALPGAVVVAQHLPTGTSVEATTGTDGRFSLAVPRAGGPYRVTVNMAGFAVRNAATSSRLPAKRHASISSCSSPG